MPERKGGCLCGAVRYALKGEPRATALCHCTHCQKQSGSLLSFNLVMREGDYEQQGETLTYVDKGDSGQPIHRHFAPGKVVVKAGTLDSMEGLKPQAEIYTDHAVNWLSPVAGTTRHARNL